MPRTPDCPRCPRSEVQRDVRVYEGIQFTLKTMDGEVHFEATGDLCDECLRKLLLDSQKCFPKLLDHGKVSRSMNWPGFIVTKKMQQTEDIQESHGVQSVPSEQEVECVEEVPEPEDGNGNGGKTKRAK